MSRYELKNGLRVEIQPYVEQHAISISENLFPGLSADLIHQQRLELLSPGDAEVYSVCCVAEDDVIGICTGVRKRWFGERHRIEIVQVVVNEKFHTLGIARLMMQTIAKHFMEKGIEIVQISVEADNIRARKAYERIGFKQFGLLPRGLRFSDKEYSDEIMLAMRCEELANQSKV